MTAPYSNTMDNMRTKMEMKYGKNKLMVNNPKGYNKHLKNPEHKVEVLTNEETFARLSKDDQREYLSNLGNKIWKESKEVRKLKSQFTKLQKIHFGWKWDEEE